MPGGTVEFVPYWTEKDIAWKSSPALIPNSDGSPLVVTGVGYAINSEGGFACERLYGGVVARNGLTGELAWEHILPGNQGDIRSSPAVADIDGDGRLEVIAAVGCGGSLIGLDAQSGALEWELALGAQTYVSPSIGDLDGDGRLEILVGSYDGKVYALGAPAD